LHFLNGLLLGVLLEYSRLFVDFLLSCRLLFHQVVLGFLESFETLNDVFQFSKLIGVLLLHSLEEGFISLQLSHFHPNNGRLLLQFFELRLL
jgi:hypothetical protein